jgi:hypothetical protein
VSQTTCNSFQQQAINTCNTSNNDTSLQSAIDQMYQLSHPNYTLPTAAPIDGTIHMAPTPTPLLVPVGYP